MTGLWRWLRGTAELRLSNVRPERFLNLCLREGVRVWAVHPSETGLTLRMAPADWARLRPAAGRMGAAAEEKIRGLPGRYPALRGREVLLFGLPAVLLCLCAATQFIWDVRVEGLSRADRTAVLDALRAEGVKIGAPAVSVREKEVQNRLLLRLPEIEWIAVNLRGCRALVQAVEKPERPEEIPAGTDLTAERDGLLTAFEVFSGTAAVTPGATVRKGQVLVWGYEEDASGARVPVTPRAYAEARSWLTLAAQTDAEARAVAELRAQRGATWLICGKIAGKISPGSGISTGEYVTITKRKYASFSLSLLTETRMTPIALTRRRDPAEVSAELYAHLRARAEEIGGRVLSETRSFEERAGAFVLRMTCETAGPIGRPAADQGEEWTRF